jgi:hypothetical protein
MKRLALISAAAIAIVVSAAFLPSIFGSAHLPVGDWPTVTIDIAMQFIQERIDRFGLNPGELDAATTITPLLSIN